MFFKRPRHDPERLTVCPACGADYVIPTVWGEQNAHAWWMRLRCGECGESREVGVPDPVAQRYDRELDRGMDDIANALKQLEHAQMTALTEAFATALRLDLVDAGDFARGG